DPDRARRSGAVPGRWPPQSADRPSGPVPERPTRARHRPRPRRRPPPAALPAVRPSDGAIRGEPARPSVAGCAARPAGRRPPAPPARRRLALPWRRSGGSCRRLARPAAAARGAAGEDPADRIGAEAAMLDRAPAVDFPEHRSEFSVGAVRPVAQRLHRANGEAGTAAEDNRPRAVAVGAGVAWTEFGRRRGEADMLDVEADQRG